MISQFLVTLTRAVLENLRKVFGEMSREKPCVKLGKVPFHGDIRDCLRPYSVKNWN